MKSQKEKMPTSVLFDVRTLLELRRRAARETLRSGKNTTTSGLVRSIVEEALFGKADEPRRALLQEGGRGQR